MGKKVLIVPLNWGLGHATRMTAVARMLEELGASVTVAASGSARRVMEKELPRLRYVSFSDFEMKYYRGLPAVVSVLGQLMGWFRALHRDRRYFLQLLEKESFDLVISDNHFGCHTTKCPSIIVTHQLRILLPWYLMPFRPLVVWINQRMINRFSECWVPDSSASGGLSGRLSHQVRLRIPLHYAGPLSRLQLCMDTNKKWHALLLLSGPEPMRTLFEQQLVKQSRQVAGRLLLVRGTRGTADEIRKESENLYVADFLSTRKLQEELCASRMVVCRSGYSTLMDLQRCNIPAVLIATPGQPEQVYLARRLRQMGICHAVPQKRLNLKKALTEAEHYAGWKSLPAENDWMNLLSRMLNVPIPKGPMVPDEPLPQKTDA
ncbi:MAG: glycosyltransferase [Chitinophagales bacterium]|nr:hypothetical protein [Chitinophagales bacterium]MDW8394202.1 glycosyltransferase [Chitinophagales bacterium]